jgi:hypothetical protein
LSFVSAKMNGGGGGHKEEYEFELETLLWGMVFGDLVEEKVRCFLQTTEPLRIVFAFTPSSHLRVEGGCSLVG